MLIDPEKVNLRIGATDRSYLNIDYDGKEIGFLKLNAQGSTHGWAHDVSNRPLVDLIEKGLSWG